MIYSNQNDLVGFYFYGSDKLSNNSNKIIRIIVFQGWYDLVKIQRLGRTLSMEPKHSKTARKNHYVKKMYKLNYFYKSYIYVG